VKAIPILILPILVACHPVDPVRHSEARFARERHRMVLEQLVVPGRDVGDPRVLDVMEEVPRHEFVPLEIRDRSYEDGPLPIGYDQTISQPFIVAFMTEHIRPALGDRVLEVGTGSGYQAAVLAKLVREVFTIEIIEPLAERAASDLHRLGYTNVNVRAGDGYEGWPEEAPFDAILVTCAPDHVPAPLVEQLKEGGRMMIPVGPPENATLYRLEKRSGQLEQTAIIPVRFVPMTGRAKSAR